MSTVIITQDALQLLTGLTEIVKDLLDSVQILRDDLAEFKKDFKQPKLLLTAEEVSEMTGLSVSFFSKGRMEGQLGNRIPPPGYLELSEGDKPRKRYEMKEVMRWIEEDLPHKHYKTKKESKNPGKLRVV